MDSFVVLLNEGQPGDSSAQAVLSVLSTAVGAPFDFVRSVSASPAGKVESKPGKSGRIPANRK